MRRKSLNAGDRRENKWHLWLMPVIAFILLLIRSRYGFSYDDEPFLVTLAQRLYYGDSLFIDEWNFTQNTGVLLLPFYRLYISIFGSPDYILLVFRGLYCFFWVVTCTLVYLVLRQKYKWAWIVYPYLLLFSPLDQMILSYTSIALMCVLLLAALFFRHTAVKQMKPRTFTVLFSVLTIIAVIASPYLGFVYGAYVLGCIIIALWKRNERTMFFLKCGLWSVVLASGALAIYVWRFMLNNYSVSEIIEKLPNMFATSIMSTNVSQRSSSLFGQIVNFWRYQLLVGVITFGISLIPEVRKSVLSRTVLFSANAFVFGYEILQQLGHKGEKPYFNLQMVPIVILGYISWWMIGDKKKHRAVFCAFTGVGLAYAYVSYVSSNTGLAALSMGLVVCGVFGILMICQLSQELLNGLGELWIDTRRKTSLWGKRLSSVFVICVAGMVFVSQLSVQSYLKFHRHYMDYPVSEMDSTITLGASKGIITGEDRTIAYEGRMKALTYLLEYVDMDKKEDIRFLSLIFDPDVYLNANLPVGSYSAWTYASTESGKEGILQKLNRYYSADPSKVPNVIFASILREDWDAIPMPDIDITDLERIDYGGYYIYIDPDLMSE